MNKIVIAIIMIAGITGSINLLNTATATQITEENSVCECGCNGECGGTCGESNCTCEKTTCGSTCSYSCGGTCGVKTCGCV